MADFNKDAAGSSLGSSKPRTNFLAQPKLLKTAVAFGNPFCRIPKDDESDTGSTPLNIFASIMKGDEKLDAVVSKPTDPPDDEKKKDDVVPVFVPLHTSRESISFTGGSSITTVPPDTSSVCDFVFGQNLKERVVNGPEESGVSSASSSTDCPSTSSSTNTEHAATNGTSSLYFTSAAQATLENQTSSQTETNSLEQSAKTWERLRESAMPSLPPQQVLTGEEEETNQIQMNCRLFAFENSLWKERGRCHLRLNDAQGSSRLVCRSAGSFRIMLNTKIWGGMTVDRAGNKSLKITATDSQQQLKIFLIMATPDEISFLHNLLTPRVNRARANENQNCDTISKTKTTEESTVAKNTPEDSEKAIASTDEAIDNESNSHIEAEVENCDSNSVVSETSTSRDNLKRQLQSDDTMCDPKKVCADTTSTISTSAEEPL